MCKIHGGYTVSEIPSLGEAAREEGLTDQPNRLTVAQAADQLGISRDAVRSRIKRGTLRAVREDGAVVVVLDADRQTINQPTGELVEQRNDDPRDELIEELRDRVQSLEDSNRENRRIIAGLVQRIPDLEAPDSRDDDYRDGPEGREEPLQRDESAGERYGSPESAPKPQASSQQVSEEFGLKPAVSARLFSRPSLLFALVISLVAGIMFALTFGNFVNSPNSGYYEQFTLLLIYFCAVAAFVIGFWKRIDRFRDYLPAAGLTGVWTVVFLYLGCMVGMVQQCTQIAPLGLLVLAGGYTVLSGLGFLFGGPIGATLRVMVWDMRAEYVGIARRVVEGRRERWVGAKDLLKPSSLKPIVVWFVIQPIVAWLLIYRIIQPLLQIVN